MIRRTSDQTSNAVHSDAGSYGGGFTPFQTPLPRSVQSWEKRRIALRKKLWQLLGDLPELFTPDAVIQQRQSGDGYELERFTFDNGIGHTVYGYVLIPSGREKQKPAILYHHYHGNKYKSGKEEVLTRAFPKLDFAKEKKVGGRKRRFSKCSYGKGGRCGG
jgi:hypothetical protein